jgi:hypothetical protein
MHVARTTTESGNKNRITTHMKNHPPAELMGAPKKYWCASIASRQLEKKNAVQIPTVETIAATAAQNGDVRSRIISP